MSISILAVFTSAFLAATILPFYSEVVLGVLSRTSGSALFLLWLFASIGNTLGAMVNWGLGRFCLRWRNHKWFPLKQGQFECAQRWFGRYGIWSLLLAWVPVGGDALTVVAGMMRVNLLLFTLLVGAGKADAGEELLRGDLLLQQEVARHEMARSRALRSEGEAASAEPLDPHARLAGARQEVAAEPGVDVAHDQRCRVFRRLHHSAPRGCRSNTGAGCDHGCVD